MNEMNQVQDDEIELFELFEILWNGKWVIGAFVAIAVSLGGSFLLLKNTIYESKLFISIYNHPPFIFQNKGSGSFEQKPYIDFQKRFFSKKVYDEWKTSNPKTSLVFEDLSTTEVVDGFVLSKPEDQMLASFELEENGNTFVLVKANLLPLVLDIFNYSNHINEMITREYVVQANDDLKELKSVSKGGSLANGEVVETTLLLTRFIESVKKGEVVLAIKNPTMPQKVAPKSSLILAMSAVLGGMVGALFIFFRNAITKRKKQLAKV